VRLGREADNDLVIGDHQQVSRHHAVVSVGAGGQLMIEDTGTRNGTKVNGRRIQGPTPFALTDEIKLGSYLLNTADLAPFVGGGGARAPRNVGPARPGDVIPMTGGGYKRVPLDPHHDASHDEMNYSSPGPSWGLEPLMTRAFQGRRTWLGSFTMFTGIFILVLFFVPMLFLFGKVIFPFMLIGSRGVSDLMQVSLVLMPIFGITLIVLKSVNLGNLTYSIALTCGFLVVLGFMTGSDDSPLSPFHGWHSVMSWMFQFALCGSLLFMAARPRDVLGKILVAVFAGLVILFFILPATKGSSGTIYVVALFKLTKLHGSMYLIAFMEIARLILTGLCFMFMSTPFLLRRSRLPQTFALVVIGLLVAEALFSGVVLYAATKQGGLLLAGFWTALFTFFAYTSPAIGMAGILTGLRRRR
jgi:hypothetical protein